MRYERVILVSVLACLILVGVVSVSAQEPLIPPVHIEERFESSAFAQVEIAKIELVPGWYRFSVSSNTDVLITFDSYPNGSSCAGEYNVIHPNAKTNLLVFGYGSGEIDFQISLVERNCRAGYEGSLWEALYFPGHKEEGYLSARGEFDSYTPNKADLKLESVSEKGRDYVPTNQSWVLIVFLGTGVLFLIALGWFWIKDRSKTNLLRGKLLIKSYKHPDRMVDLGALGLCQYRIVTAGRKGDLVIDETGGGSLPPLEVRVRWDEGVNLPIVKIIYDPGNIAKCQKGTWCVFAEDLLIEMDRQVLFRLCYLPPMEQFEIPGW